MEKLQMFLNEIKELSPQDMQLLAKEFELLRLNKGDALHEEGDFVDTIAFLEEGILHHFNYNDLGERKTLNLVEGPNFCTDLESFSEGKRTTSSCVALTDCTVYVLKKDKYDIMINSHVKWSNLAKEVIERELFEMMDQIKSVANMSLEERYLELLKTKPAIIQNVSLQIIASYLGTSRETLHRIRRKIVHS